MDESDRPMPAPSSASVSVPDPPSTRAKVRSVTLIVSSPDPPIATSATDNELGCLWLEFKDTNPEFQLFTIDGTTTVVRTAARKALAALNGVEDTFPELVRLPVFVDTLNGKLPECREDLPPDADLSSNLTDEELKAIFAQ